MLCITMTTFMAASADHIRAVALRARVLTCERYRVCLVVRWSAIPFFTQRGSLLRAHGALVHLLICAS
jgi:hypothetical protein